MCVLKKLLAIFLIAAVGLFTPLAAPAAEGEGERWIGAPTPERPDLIDHAFLLKFAANPLLAEPNSTPRSDAAPHADRSRGKGLNWHKYLGYATVALAFAAAPTRSSKSLHYTLAYSSAASAVGTVVTGYLQHRDELRADQRGLLGPVNRHALLGGLGALAIVTAVAVADSGNNGSHATLGITGASLMLVSIVDIRW